MRGRSLVSLLLVLTLVACAGNGKGGGPATTGADGATTAEAPSDPTTTEPTPSGAGDSWFEVDGKRYEVAVLLRCDMETGPGLPPPHDDDFSVIAAADDLGQQFRVTFTGLRATSGSDTHNPALCVRSW